MEKSGILYKVLGVPKFYNLFRKAIAKDPFGFVKSYLPEGHFKLLDVGCGPGTLFSALSDLDVEYVGVDYFQRYVDEAKQKFGSKGTFICEDLSKESLDLNEKFDVIFLGGVLHHLDDATIGKILSKFPKLLNPNGFVLTIDPCFHKDQSLMSRFLVGKDRGEFVRDYDDYIKFFDSNLFKITSIHKNDLLNIPYDHTIIKAELLNEVGNE